MIIKQIKSHWYYVFWGICAVSVVGGQLYVGSGYREMAEATKSTAISVTCAPSTTPRSYTTSRLNRRFEFE